MNILTATSILFGLLSSSVPHWLPCVTLSYDDVMSVWLYTGVLTMQTIATLKFTLTA